MDRLEEIRQRKLEQLQQMQQQRIMEERQEQAVFQQKVDMLEQFVKSRLTKDALMRYGNIKTADPDKAIQVLATLGQALQSNDIMINDIQLKEMLLRMAPEKRESKIVRK
jgi:DNA-binding TFAR19-related protein (PDSD5 family)